MEGALIASNIALWIAVVVLAGIMLALLRQIGVLHERVAPAGALMGAEGPRVGEAAAIVPVVTWSGLPISLGAPNPEGASTPSHHGAFEVELMVLRLGDERLDIPAGHVLAHDVGLAVVLAHVVNGHDVGMAAEPAHRFGLALDALPPGGVEPLRLDDGEGDVAVEAACRSAVETVGDSFGPVEVLINNAGIGPSSLRPDAERRLPSVTELTPEIWSRFFAVNVTGAYLMLRAVLPQMRGNGWGRVINNTTSFFTMLRVLPYGATKAALEGASAVWAKELEGTGVTVNVVVPGGPTDTAFIADQSGIDRDKMLRPEVMAAPVRWLASDLADGVTGRRFVAARWDDDVPTSEAAEKSAAPIGWPDLAAATVIWPDD